MVTALMPVGIFPDRDELQTRWIEEIGTEPPEFDGESVWKYLDQLTALPWADSFRWATSINGRELLPGQVRKLQRAHGFDGFPGDREAVLRRAGNGCGRGEAFGLTRAEVRALRDIGVDVRHVDGNWERVNGTRGVNLHNLIQQGRAALQRVRVRSYCLSAWRNALQNGGVFDLKSVFKAACRAIFGHSQPYANRSKGKALREWVEAAIELEKMSPTPERRPIEARGAMGYGATAPRNDSEITHLPGRAGAPSEEEHRQPGLTAPAGCAAACGAAPGGAAPGPVSTNADTSVPEGLSPSRAAEAAAGPSRMPDGKRGVPPPLAGIARSALPTLRAAHTRHNRVGWAHHATGAGAQSRWAFGWLCTFLQRGRCARDLVRLYLAALARHDEKARAHGFGPEAYRPHGLRRDLQRAAETLPTHAPEVFGANPARFAPTAAELEARREREEARAARAAAKVKRVRRKSAAGMEKMGDEFRAMFPHVFAAAPAEPAKPEWLQRFEDDEADRAAELAASSMDRRNARRAPISERDQWARDLGNA